MGLPNHVLMFYLNGERMVVRAADPTQSLIHYIRDDCHLTGTKLSEREGRTGSSTVIVCSFDKTEKKVRYEPVDSCIYPLCAVDGKAVITIEALGISRDGLHPIQQRFVDNHATQCGFSTPGFILTLLSVLLNNSEINPELMQKSLTGNICRDTGFRPILKVAASLATDKIPHDQLMTEKCQFPKELETFESRSLAIETEDAAFFQPLSLKETLALKQTHPEAIFVAGNTAAGVEAMRKRVPNMHTISLLNVAELGGVSRTADGAIVFGAAVPLATVKATLETKCDAMQDVVLENLEGLAGLQIRNQATLGGSIAWASTFSDLDVALCAAGALVSFVNAEGAATTVPLVEFIEKRPAGVFILTQITLPAQVTGQHAWATKAGRWGYVDGQVSLGLNVALDGEKKVTKACVVYGGVGERLRLATATATALVGKPWALDLAEALTDSILKDCAPHICADTIGVELADFQRTLTVSLFVKAAANIAARAGMQIPAELSTITARQNQWSLQEGDQDYPPPQGTALGLPMPNMTAPQNVTGEATYVGDVQLPVEGLHGALVLSTEVHAKIISIDPSCALAVPGVVSFISAKDVPGKNVCGTIWSDEEVFAESEVRHHGQAIGMVLSRNREIALKAAPLVKVVYEKLPAILTVDDAVRAQSFFPFPAFGAPKTFPNPNPMRVGLEVEEVDQKLKEAEHVLEGECELQGQEHYYEEPQSTLVVPNEGGFYTVTTASQVAAATQGYVAQVLGCDRNKVNTRVKRVGGGFGGKESKSTAVSLAAAVGAYVTNKPVSLVLERDDDLKSTGGRHAMKFIYRIGYDSKGKISVYDVKILSNCGYSYDFASSVTARCVFKCTNAYKYENCRVEAFLCKTNLRSSTAFRGFGDPQGMFVAEHIIERVAALTGVEPHKVRELNFIHKGERMHYSQLIEDDNLDRVWDQATKGFEAKLAEVNEFNTTSKYIKRGIAAVPTLYGLSFTQKFLCQGHALVHMYQDGSVLVSCGGVEMGQGLYTKMRQVAADHLRIPFEKVHIEETATDKCANTVPTAASTGSDLNAGAIADACSKLNEVMNKHKEEMGFTDDTPLDQVAKSCFMNRVNLSALGHYKIPDLNFDWGSGQGRAFNYFTNGCAIVSVEVDTLTGATRMLTTDIVMDVGTPLNPMLDIGQIEGGFIQGCGLSTFEKISHTPEGVLRQTPLTYTLPTSWDIPRSFNVGLLHDSKNIRSTYSSKGIGEPPLGMGMTTLSAVLHALKAVRRDNGLQGPEVLPVLNCPMCPEHVRLACADPLIAKAVLPKDEAKVAKLPHLDIYS